MWKIKDPELKAKVNQFFTDKEIHEEFEKNTDLYNYFRLSTVNKKGLCVTITVEKELVEFVPEYQENDWNPYPELRPPANGRYLVTRQMKIDNGDTAIFIQLAGFENGQWYMKNDVIAFRELPQPYAPKYERKPWDDDDSEPEEGD